MRRIIALSREKKERTALVTKGDRMRCSMINQRMLVLCGIVLVGVGSAWSQQRGGVLKPSDGERLPGERQTIIKASPRSGTQNVELFRDTMPSGISTGVHVHRQADEFFYVISGKGLASIDGTELPVEADDIVFVPRGHNHGVKSSGPMPLELVFLVDRPGLASDFRESRSEALVREATVDPRRMEPYQ